MTPREELIERLKQINIFSPEEVEFKHGNKGRYADVKMAYGDPEVLSLISSEIWKQMDKRTTCIAANGYGGISIASIISEKYKVHLSLVRDEPKKHGKGGLIDGYVPTAKDYVSIYDDVLTTGGTLEKIIEIMKPTGAMIVGCYVSVKRGEADLGIPLHYIFTLEELS